MLNGVGEELEVEPPSPKRPQIANRSSRKCMAAAVNYLIVINDHRGNPDEARDTYS